MCMSGPVESSARHVGPKARHSGACPPTPRSQIAQDRPRRLGSAGLRVRWRQRACLASGLRRRARPGFGGCSRLRHSPGLRTVGCASSRVWRSYVEPFVPSYYCGRLGRPLCLASRNFCSAGRTAIGFEPLWAASGVGCYFRKLPPQRRRRGRLFESAVDDFVGLV